MNKIKVKLQTKVLTETSEKYGKPGDFINNKIDDIWSQEKMFGEEVIDFLVSIMSCYNLCFLVILLAVKQFLDKKHRESLRFTVA